MAVKILETPLFSDPHRTHHLINLMNHGTFFLSDPSPGPVPVRRLQVWPPIEPLEIRQPTMSLGSRVHGPAPEVGTTETEVWGGMKAR